MATDGPVRGKKSAAEKLATVGAAMIALSIVLALAGVEGAAFHNVMQLAGVGLGVVGIVVWRFLGRRALREQP